LDDGGALVYSLQWLHDATPPDFHLQLAKDEPELWAE
jgi:hypothetical protein